MDTTVLARNTSAGRSNLATGSFVSDGTVVNVRLGFTPRVVRTVNVTTPATFTKTNTMPAANSVNTVASGATTVNTSSAVVIVEDGFVMSVAAAGTAQTIHYIAED